jgi:hypothetical protein
MKHLWVVALPLTALWTLVPGWPDWLAMTAIAFSILGVLKTTVLVEYYRRSRSPLKASEILCWYLTWPGLNAREFWGEVPAERSTVSAAEWFQAIAKTSLGAICLGALAPRTASLHPLLGGWIAMVGIVLVLHFGAFHLLALAWRQWGREVKPIMHEPLRATAVGDFWSHRWNLAFRDYANLFVMRPLARRWNGTVAMWGCFVFSGFVHELAISVPARAGYGLPMGYFLLQAIGASFERSNWGQRLGLRKGWRGWLYAFLLIGPPAFLLFHPPFVLKVILPLVTEVGAIP